MLEEGNGGGKQKTAIMEVNYEGVIAEGKISRSKESIGDSALPLPLPRPPRLPSYRHTQRDRSFLQL